VEEHKLLQVDQVVVNMLPLDLQEVVIKEAFHHQKETMVEMVVLYQDVVKLLEEVVAQEELVVILVEQVMQK
jgi:hypothetical protein